MIKKFVHDNILKVLKDLGVDEPVNFDVDSPPDPKMGDFATNVAMVLSHEKKQNPKELAEKIVVELNKVEKIKSEVAGPGFINIKLDNSLYIDELKNILNQKENYGKQEIGKGKKVNVEFISANPTGPIHIGNARGGPIGEAISNLYEFLGYNVDREFYVNDIGGQIDKLGESIYYWYEKSLGEEPEFPEEGYPGDYIKEVFQNIAKKKKVELEGFKEKDDIVSFFKHEGVKTIIERIDKDAKLINIDFDQWVMQSKFEDSGASEAVVNYLKEKDLVVQKEGALWYQNPEDKELQDEESVLQKSDDKKTMTYFADDIAYHKDKIDRGYDELINVWGSNHHGHVSRLKAALKSLDLDSEKLKIILYQFVRLKEAGKVVKMGKRTGRTADLKDLIDGGVSPDAFKYFILSQNLNTPIDFDLKLAKDTSEKNPVFYIQYAHARICSILRKVEDSGPSVGMEEGGDSEADLSLLTDKRELALIRELTKLPELLVEIKESFQIQALPHFAFKIATLFHDFYANCQVLSEDKKLSAARLALASSTKNVLKNVLAVCDISAPDKM